MGFSQILILSDLIFCMFYTNLEKLSQRKKNEKKKQTKHKREREKQIILKQKNPPHYSSPLTQPFFTFAHYLSALVDTLTYFPSLQSKQL